MAFVHYTVKKIVHGLGAIKEAANEVKNLKGSKAFIVTDPGLAKIGVQKPLEEALTDVYKRQAQGRAARGRCPASGRSGSSSALADRNFFAVRFF